MAIEARRGCGYRKCGGIYLVGGLEGEPCHRLPVPLPVCPTCGHGVRQSRGWNWVTPEILGGPCALTATEMSSASVMALSQRVEHCSRCPVCLPTLLGERAGLIWIGEQFYPTVESFEREAAQLGVSRRVKAVPRGFRLGEHFVLLAHPLAIPPVPVAALHLGTDEPQATPGIFRVFRPRAIEKLLWQRDATPERLAEMTEAGLTPVVVPDGDRDHAGSAYDRESATSD